MILTLLFSSLIFSQSFSEKPEVPVFHIEGQRVVRVDCWQGADPMYSHYLVQTEHPQVFSGNFNLSLYSKMEIEVSLLKAESTLRMVKYEEDDPRFEVETYGMDCGFTTREESLYCSVFDGEIFENWVLNSIKRI